VAAYFLNHAPSCDDWYCSEPRVAFNRIVVFRYRTYVESRQLASGTINLQLDAIRRLAYEAADCGLLSADLAAGIRRVKGVRKLGVRLGNWLTAEQDHALWPVPNNTSMKGKRDRALLALLLACGPRRHEAVSLVTKLAPHDLRRTCAKLCQASGGELEQIQFLLGHVSVRTTERYQGSQQRIRSAVNDRIGIEPKR